MGSGIGHISCCDRLACSKGEPSLPKKNEKRAEASKLGLEEVTDGNQP